MRIGNFQFLVGNLPRIKPKPHQFSHVFTKEANLGTLHPSILIMSTFGLDLSDSSSLIAKIGCIALY